jgi:Sugar-specific transcriptional regulator TrmB/Bacterial regulatory proteins, luxR family
MSVLGLGEAERIAYELLVDASPATVDELAVGWTRPEPLAGVLARLEERSLVSAVPGTPPRYRAQSPRVAFDTALTEFEEALEHARRHVAVLETAYQARPAAPDSSVVELVTGQRVVRQRLARLRAGARERVDCLFKPPSLFAQLAESDPLRQGLACRTVYDRAGIEHVGALATVERRIEEGELAKVLPDLPVSMCVFDGRMAALPLQRHPAAPDAIMVVHPSALLDAMITLFDGLWRRALPLHPAAHAVAGPREAEDPTRLVTLLLSGLTDESIAHQLGLSHRTVQRRVATMMAELGAHTRFQAGVRAALAITRRES